MSKVVIAGDASGTGTFTISAPNGNTDRTLVLPDEAGTVLTTAGVPASAMPAGSVLQVATDVFTGPTSTSVAGFPNVITNGTQLFSISFTPQFSNSLILVQTSSINISEETNSGDMGWVALWDGGTFIAANSGSPRYVHFASNLNSTHVNVNNAYVAGSTSTRVIQVRAGFSGGTAYVNGNSQYYYTGGNAVIEMIVWEIKQ